MNFFLSDPLSSHAMLKVTVCLVIIIIRQTSLARNLAEGRDSTGFNIQYLTLKGHFF